MLKIIGNDIKRGITKIGWAESDHIRDHEGKKVMYFTSDDVFRESDGKKVGYINGNNLYVVGGPTVRIDDLREKYVVGGMIPNVARAAAWIFFGD